MFTNLYSLLQVSTAVVFRLCLGRGEGGLPFRIQCLLLPDIENVSLRQGGDTVGLTCLPSAPPHHGVYPRTPTRTHVHPQSDCSGTSMGLLGVQGEQLERCLDQRVKAKLTLQQMGLQAIFPISYLLSLTTHIWNSTSAYP